MNVSVDQAGACADGAVGVWPAPNGNSYLTVAPIRGEWFGSSSNSGDRERRFLRELKRQRLRPVLQIELLSARRLVSSLEWSGAKPRCSPGERCIYAYLFMFDLATTPPGCPLGVINEPDM